MEERWIRWEPLPGLMKRYFIDQFTDNKDIEIILEDAVEDSKRIRILFDGALCMYRYTNELMRIRLIHELEKKYTADFLNWSLFKVENSSYIKWLSAESDSISDRYAFQHFAFITEDGILDILSFHEPLVELMNSSSNFSN